MLSISSLTLPHLQPVYVRQKAAENKQDIATLENYLTTLVTLFQGPLKNFDRCPPALDQSIKTLSRSLFCHHFLVLAVCV